MNSKRNLSIGLNDLAGALHASGASGEALDCYQESLELLDQLLDSDPENEELLGDQAITFLWTATTWIEMTHWDEALDTANGAVTAFVEARRK